MEIIFKYADCIFFIAVFLVLTLGVFAWQEVTLLIKLVTKADEDESLISSGSGTY